MNLRVVVVTLACGKPAGLAAGSNQNRAVRGEYFELTLLSYGADFVFFDVGDWLYCIIQLN